MKNIDGGCFYSHVTISDWRALVVSPIGDCLTVAASDCEMRSKTEITSCIKDTRRHHTTMLDYYIIMCHAYVISEL